MLKEIVLIAILCAGASALFTHYKNEHVFRTDYFYSAFTLNFIAAMVAYFVVRGIML